MELIPDNDPRVVCRYYIEEAASGTAPTSWVDVSPNSYDLTDIAYGAGDMAYNELATGRGVDMLDTAGNNYARRQINDVSDAFRDAIEGSTAYTLELVIDLQAISGSIGRIFAVNRTGGQSPDIGLVGTQVSALNVYFNGSSVLNVNTVTSGRKVLHVVVDSTQPVTQDRIRIYDDGVDITPTSGVSLGQNATISLNPGSDLIVGNRESSGSFQRSWQGFLGYACWYSAPLTAQECADNAAVLVLNDDQSATGPTLDDITLSTPTTTGLAAGTTADFTSADGGFAYAGLYLPGNTPSHADIVAGTGAGYVSGSALSASITAGTATFAEFTGADSDTAYDLWVTGEDSSSTPVAAMDSRAFTTLAPSIDSINIGAATLTDSSISGVQVTVTNVDGGSITSSIYPPGSTPTPLEILSGAGGAVAGPLQDVVTTSPETVTQGLLTGLDPSTSYEYHTVAFDASGNSVQDFAPFTTLAQAVVIQEMLVDVQTGQSIAAGATVEYAFWPAAALSTIGAPTSQGTTTTLDPAGGFNIQVDVTGVFVENDEVIVLFREVVAGGAPPGANDNWSSGGVAVALDALI